MAKYKVRCLNNIAPIALETLGDDFEVTEDLGEADAVLVRSADMHELDLPDSLKCVARAGAGTNNIPLEELAARGVPVFNAPGANANAVKELVVCALLLASRDVVGGVEWCKANADDENVAKAAEKAKKQFAGTEILGKTLGVIGLGAIGRLVVGAAEALGMKTIGYDPFKTPEVAREISPDMRFVDNLDDLYAGSDYVTVHVPAVGDNIGMINADAIAKMKDGVKLLNLARGSLVNEDDLAAALASGKISTYVCDFVSPAVLKMDHVVAFPHLGASTAEAEENCAQMAAQSIRTYLETGEKVHCVNMK
ncbi:MAG: 3-phosphoglycerate dehydrogenase [Coriobacteriales bacterium]